MLWMEQITHSASKHGDTDSAACPWLQHISSFSDKMWQSESKKEREWRSTNRRWRQGKTRVRGKDWWKSGCWASLSNTEFDWVIYSTVGCILSLPLFLYLSHNSFFSPPRLHFLGQRECRAGIISVGDSSGCAMKSLFSFSTDAVCERMSVSLSAHMSTQAPSVVTHTTHTHSWCGWLTFHIKRVGNTVTFNISRLMLRGCSRDLMSVCVYVQMRVCLKKTHSKHSYLFILVTK